MNNIKLIVMAAGLGSRYGGLKQMESVTEQDEIILDFAVYDAMKAGFKDIIFVIKPEMEESFRERVLSRMSKHLRVSYVFQDLRQLPKGYEVPKDRTKPWGTCHAVMACAELIDGPFAVINADDYYGYDAFEKVYGFLSEDSSDNTYCMAGYYIENTLSEQGTVTRGICNTDQNNMLLRIRETRKIGRVGDKIMYPDSTGAFSEIAEGTVVSMNFWGFKQSMMCAMEQNFPAFLDGAVKENPLKAEYLLPIEVGKMLDAGEISVKVLKAKDKWYGVTYQEDKALVTEAFARMKKEGKYPQVLWP